MFVFAGIQVEGSFVETNEYRNWRQELARAAHDFKLCQQEPAIDRDTALEVAREDFKREGAIAVGIWKVCNTHCLLYGPVVDKCLAVCALWLIKDIAQARINLEINLNRINDAYEIAITPCKQQRDAQLLIAKERFEQSLKRIIR